MKQTQIQEMSRMRKAVELAEQNLARKRTSLIILRNKCDHRFSNRRSAMKVMSTHNDRTCGGWKECAVCAGELPETFVEVCRICQHHGEEFREQPPLAKPIRL